MPELFTIGHSNHSLERFLALLQMHRIEALADVRSSPYSARLPHFNRESLEAALRQAGIGYDFLGRHLGARRTERDCYVGNRASYELISELPTFKEGMECLLARLGGRRTALMCAEKDPLDCHRTILVCRALRNRGLQIAHILEDGSIEQHGAAERRLLAEESVPAEDFFKTSEELLESAYRLRGDRIAYREEPEVVPAR